MAPQTNTDETFDADMTSIAAASNAIFNRSDAGFTTSTGFVVKVQPAKTRHLSYAVKFLETLANSLSEAQLHNLVVTFAAEQKKMIDSGGDPNSIQAAEIARAAVGNASILLSLAAKVSGELPILITVFTNLSAEQVEEMEIEETVMTICKIFLVNYSFFTRTLRPILVSFMGALFSTMEQAKDAGV